MTKIINLIWNISKLTSFILLIAGLVRAFILAIHLDFIAIMVFAVLALLVNYYLNH